MKASIAFSSLLLGAAATAALRGQQHSLHDAKTLETNFEDEGSFVSSGAAGNRHKSRVPDDAAGVNLHNEEETFQGSVELKLDSSGLISPALSKERRLLSLMAADRSGSAYIMPEEMKDCDPKQMKELGMDCDSIFDTAMGGGGMTFEVSESRGDEVPEEERYGEEYYIKELMRLTGEDDYDTTLFLEDESVKGDDDRANRRRLTYNYDTRNSTIDIGIFEPLECNSAGLPSADECDANPDGFMSTLVADAGDDPVVIPCGECIKYDLPLKATSVIHGLDIHGKLYIPPNYKSTLHTPFVFVQGELQMSDNQIISPENESMKIVLTGTENITFTPADSNNNVNGTPFNAGFKPFLVAGGKVDIRGWDIAPGQERVASWTPVSSDIEGPPPKPVLKAHHLVPVPIQPVNTTRTCPRIIAEDNFTDFIDYSLWSGGDGAVVTHDAEQGVMVVSNINRNWQGPRIDITKLTIDCPLQAGVDYLLTVRIKIDKPGMEGDDMPCHNTTSVWGDCPRWMRKIMLKDGTDRYSHRHLYAGTLGKYGEWFTFATVWQYEEVDIGENVTGNIFAIENLGTGVTLTMDEFIFELPSENSFPPVNGTCTELVVNGDAENTDGRGWAFYPMWSSRSYSYEPAITKEVLSNGVVNKFYRAENRLRYYDSIRFNMVQGCFVQAMTYWISLRVRVSSEEPLSYRVRIVAPKTDGSGWLEKDVLYCPPQTWYDGWVSCSGPYGVEVDLATEINGDVEFRVYTDHKVDKDDSVLATVDFDDISVTFMAGPAEGLNVDKNVVPRWGANADVHITSSTINSRDSQNAVIESIVSNAEDRHATINLQTGIDTILTDKDTPGMGVEVTLLSRNIKIEGEAGTALEGGYFQVLHTPGVAQVIEGVEFVNMGQQQGKNRFSLQFLYSGDVPGTSIARNSIRQSNHRCIVLEGSSNITVEANVAYDTAGHCYYVGSDATDNTLLYNIGSRTNDNIYWGNYLSGESDYSRATFQLYNPRNDYIGNVAAGSDGRGFGMYLSWRTLGEDYVDTEKGSIRRLEMKSFRDNKAHSNQWQGFSIADFEQFFEFRDFDRVPVFENIQSYRNREHGIYSNNLVAAQFIGGAVADNQWGFILRESDHVLIDGMPITGLTDTLKFITTPVNREKICSRSNWSHEGLQIMTRKSRYGEQDPNRGLRLKNVVFSDFDKNTNSCPLGSWPISFNDRVTDSHFDYTSSMENVTISDSRGLFIDGCKASSNYGVNDLVITDLDGYLVASIAGAPLEEATAGVFVSNTDFMLFDDCIPYPENCLAFCPGTCLRTVSYSVEQYGTEDFKLLVEDDTGNSRLIPGKLEPGDYYSFSKAFKPRKFSVSLPAGTYTARFVDQEMNNVWPTYVEELWEAYPDCSSSAGPLDIKLLEPHVDSSYCDELIRNGGQDQVLTTSEPWVHTDPGVQVRYQLGPDYTDVISTIHRERSYTGLGQSIDSRCVDKMRDRYVEFSAWISLNNNGTPATEINPDSSMWNRESPQLSLHSKQYRDLATKEYIYRQETNDIAQLARPYNSDGWNLIHGIFRLPSSLIFEEIYL